MKSQQLARRQIRRETERKQKLPVMLPDINNGFVSLLISFCVCSDMYNLYMGVVFVLFCLVSFFKCGACCGARTHDPEIMT